MNQAKCDKTNNIYKRLRAIYNEKHIEDGITQEELGKLFNTSRSTISRIEKGEIEPDAELLRRYAQFFKVSTDYLLTGEITDQSVLQNTVLMELGLSPDAIDTLKELKRVSQEGYNLMAVMNALLGNKGSTVVAVQNIHSYLAGRTDINFYRRAIEGYLVSVKPKLEKELRASRLEDEEIEIFHQEQRILGLVEDACMPISDE